ncbi:membrane-spanning 4-domains subfamily A member 8-like [Saccopteryx leptura]|uniref:membrane-spanning 4-domains subfamily A member 8-like n=1 Tax=Saccopteryx leptura TaxID=249018 RepID=UPI00339C2169
MTSAGSVDNPVFPVVHHKRPEVSGIMSQVPQYPFNHQQVQPVPDYNLRFNGQVGQPPVYSPPAQRTLTEGKVLGAIQIILGLIHISLGGVLATVVAAGPYPGVSAGPYTAVSFYGGYPFWGGIMFIISGCLSVSAEQQPNSSCLLQSSVGMNIFSAICSLVGIAVLITDLCINSPYYHFDDYFYWVRSPGLAASAVLLVFSLLQFCITCTSAHFGCQLVGHSHNNGPVVVYPNVFVANTMANPHY